MIRILFIIISLTNIMQHTRNFSKELQKNLMKILIIDSLTLRLMNKNNVVDKRNQWLYHMMDYVNSKESVINRQEFILDF